MSHHHAFIATSLYPAHKKPRTEPCSACGVEPSCESISPSGGAMRRSFTLFSIVTHGIVIACALVAQVIGDSALPVPKEPLQFTAERIMPVDVHAPQRPRHPATTTPDAPRVSPDTAPIVAPGNVMPETGDEGMSRPATGLISGVQGAPADIE